jgi:hypothetical protein
MNFLSLFRRKRRGAGDGAWSPTDNQLNGWVMLADQMAARARVWAAEPGGSLPTLDIPRTIIDGVAYDLAQPGPAHAREAWERAARELRAAHRAVLRARQSNDPASWEQARILSVLVAGTAQKTAEELDNRVLLSQPGL